MSDDDDLNAALRRTMASLDRQVPAGYFEALPERTLARLDDPDIGAGIGQDIGAATGDDGDAPGTRDLASDLDRARAARAAAAPRRRNRAVITAGLGAAVAASAVLFVALRSRDDSRAEHASAPGAMAP